MRREVHRLLVEWYYHFYHEFTQHHFPAGLTFTVGVGEKSYNTVFYNPQDYLLFLQTEESLVSYGDSSLEAQHLANVFNVNIYTFSYNVAAAGGGNTTRWTYITPQQEVVAYSHLARRECQPKDCYILHEDDCHYDLLVARPTPTQQLVTNNSEAVVNSSETVVNSSETVVNDNITENEEHEVIIGDNTPDNCFSPFNFAPGVKSRGRKPKKRGGPPIFNKSKRQRESSPTESAQSKEQTAPPKKRGRPKGSKNKPKEPSQKKTLSKAKPKVTVASLNSMVSSDRIRRGVRAAQSLEICRICDFEMEEDPYSDGDEGVNCGGCELLVHRSCLRGDGCPVCAEY